MTSAADNDEYIPIEIFRASIAAARRARENSAEAAAVVQQHNNNHRNSVETAENVQTQTAGTFIRPSGEAQTIDPSGNSHVAAATPQQPRRPPKLPNYTFFDGDVHDIADEWTITFFIDRRKTKSHERGIGSIPYIRDGF